ncbi:MAG: PorV/PorQ family protein [Elusimicrobiota bacterium]|nr:PorV/PorQ family protein [Elusimicrobiota bacterium]
MKNKTAIVLAIGLAAGCAGLARAGDYGTASGLFLRLPPAAAGTGMGEAGAAVVAGSPAIFVNPAGLSGVKGGYASFTHSAWLDSLNYNVLSVAVKTKQGGVIGCGLRYLSYGNMETLDNTGALAGGMSPRDLSAEVGWGKELSKRRSVGFSVKYVSARIKRTASTFAADIGVTQRAGRNLFGAVLQNAGGGLKYGAEEYPLPLNLKLGAGIPYGADLLGVFDINITRGSNPWLAVGGKYTLFVNNDLSMALRAGYNTASGDTGGISGFSAGFGLLGRSASFDYSLRTMGELGLTHHLGISLKWDIVHWETVTLYGK